MIGMKRVSKNPTFDKRSGNFFMLPEIARTLRNLLNKEDYYYLAKGHTKEGPINLIDNYLQIYVCGSRHSYGCDNNTLLVINLTDGSMHIVFDMYDEKPRYYSTKGCFTDLPKKVQLPSANYTKSGASDEQVIIFRLPRTPTTLATTSLLTAEWRAGEPW
jgi:hypothetical protein